MSDAETLITLTADIVAAHLGGNTVPVSDVPALIRSVHDALAGLGKEEPEVEATAAHVPATTVRKSLADPTKIISMIDGKPYSMLKRHLSQHGLTPDEYRKRYNLPANYPMTAPAYSEQRKALAVKIGLGRKAKGDVAPPPPPPPARKPRARKAAAAS